VLQCRTRERLIWQQVPRPRHDEASRALGACAAFEGDVLIIESERDDIVPHPVIANYMAAFQRAHSMTYRVIARADHGLSEQPWQQAYTSLLLNWTTEMVLRVREGGGAPEVQTEMRPLPRRGPARPA
jgi:uncharacterized protein